MIDPIIQVLIQILGYWILNKTWKIGATTYKYSIQLILFKSTQKDILKLMNVRKTYTPKPKVVPLYVQFQYSLTFIPDLEF